MRKISGLQELHVAQGGWTMLERGGSGLGATSRCWRGSMGLVTASGLDLGTPGIQARISSWEVTGWHFFFFFHHCFHWEEEVACPKLLDQNVILGKLICQHHVSSPRTYSSSINEESKLWGWRRITHTSSES